MTCPALKSEGAFRLACKHSDASSRPKDNGAKRGVERGPEMKIWLASPPNTARSAMTKREKLAGAPPRPAATVVRQSLEARCWRRSDNNHPIKDTGPDRKGRSAPGRRRMGNAPNGRWLKAVAPGHRDAYDQTKRPSVPPARTAPAAQMVESWSETNSSTD